MAGAGLFNSSGAANLIPTSPLAPGLGGGNITGCVSTKDSPCLGVKPAPVGLVRAVGSVGSLSKLLRRTLGALYLLAGMAPSAFYLVEALFDVLDGSEESFSKDFSARPARAALACLALRLSLRFSLP